MGKCWNLPRTQAASCKSLGIYVADYQTIPRPLLLAEVQQNHRYVYTLTETYSRTSHVNTLTNFNTGIPRHCCTHTHVQTQNRHIDTNRRTEQKTHMHSHICIALYIQTTQMHRRMNTSSCPHLWTCACMQTYTDTHLQTHAHTHSRHGVAKQLLNHSSSLRRRWHFMCLPSLCLFRYSAPHSQQPYLICPPHHVVLFFGMKNKQCWGD